MNPKQLIEQAKRGDKEAFGKLYALFFVPVFRYIYLRVEKKEEAEDLTQTVFLKVYQSVERYEDKGQEPLAYFFTVARNSVIDFWRKKKELSLEGEMATISEIESKDDSPLNKLERDETAKKVRSAINKLEGLQKEVVILKYLSDLTNTEIAKILGKNEAAIRQIQHRALQKLKKVLKGV